MPFLLAEILNFQGSAHLMGVGSLSKLKERGIRDQFKIMVGGSPISQKYADEIGADGYSVNAVEAVKLAKRLMGIA